MEQLIAHKILSICVIFNSFDCTFPVMLGELSPVNFNVKQEKNHNYTYFGGQDKKRSGQLILMWKGNIHATAFCHYKAFSLSCKLGIPCEAGWGSGLLMLRHAEDSFAGERSLCALLLLWSCSSVKHTFLFRKLLTPSHVIPDNTFGSSHHPLQSSFHLLCLRWLAKFCNCHLCIVEQ